MPINNTRLHIGRVLTAVLLTLCLYAAEVKAQTTSFSYQGKLSDGGVVANGAYDLQFLLFDKIVAGVQQGMTLTLDDVQVTDGIFTVVLNFGGSAFPGADRFLEIAMRPGVSVGAYTTLSPRQQITSTPYAVRSLNASTADRLSVTCVGCVTAAQIAACRLIAATTSRTPILSRLPATST